MLLEAGLVVVEDEAVEAVIDAVRIRETEAAFGLKLIENFGSETVEPSRSKSG